MPLNIDLFQILLHVFNFLLLAGGLTLLLFKPVNRFLEERQTYFDKATLEVEKKTAENEKLREEYESKLHEANEAVTQLRAKAERELLEKSHAYMESVRERADAIVLAAEKEAIELKEHMMDSAQAEISDLVVRATQKLLGGKATAESDSALYDEFIRVAAETVADKRGEK